MEQEKQVELLAKAIIKCLRDRGLIVETRFSQGLCIRIKIYQDIYSPTVSIFYSESLEIETGCASADRILNLHIHNPDLIEELITFIEECGKYSDCPFKCKMRIDKRKVEESVGYENSYSNRRWFYS